VFLLLPFLAGTLVFAAVVFVMSLFSKDSPLIESTISLWSRLFLATAPVQLEVDGRHLIDPSRQYVFAANHLSNYDIPVMLLTAPVPIRFLAKKELFRIPLLAQAMRRIGIIETDRQASSAAHARINEGVADAKRRGHSIIVFPEGTRSDDGELADFKKGAFRIAIANDLPVVPVTIHGTWEAWPPGSKLVYPARATATVHEPIPTADLTLLDINDLKSRVHAAVASALPAGNVG
jgi:1-acyl-sn-glycerol-3-phosphate acyltransferase